MDREFSKDISIYKKKAWKGFSTYEIMVGVGVIALGSAITWFFMTKFKLPMIAAGYMDSFLIIPIIFLLFKKKRGYTLIQILLKRKELRMTSGKMPYRSDEMQILGEDGEYENSKKKKRKKTT